MKTTIKQFFGVLVLIINISTSEVNAQDNAIQNKTIFSIETDPATFLLDGYSFHVRMKPKNSEHFVIGLGTYALDIPDVMISMNKKNKDKGWNVRIQSAYALFGEYYLKDANSKWFVGLQAGIQNFKNSNGNIPNQEMKYSNFILMPSLGYNWLPFKFPLYIKPWMGIGYTSKISGNNSIENLEYDISPISPFITVHVGYILN